MSPTRILREPPVVERAETILRSGDLPIQLRGEVIDPAFSQPTSRIGVDLVIRVEAGDPPRRTRTPNPERTHTDEDRGFDPFHLAVHRLDERVDIRAAPRVAITPTARASVFAPGGVVGKWNVLKHAHTSLSDALAHHAVFAIWIEIVVDA